MHKTIKTVAVAAGLALAGVSAQPAIAQSEGGTIIQGLGIASFDAVIANSAAFKAAEQQRQTTYKAQLDQAKTRNQQLTTQLQPMIDKFNTDRQAANANEATLQQQAAQIQQLQQQGQQELQQILAPVALSRAYVNEQIEEKLNDAVKAAMAKKSISILLSPDAILAVNGGAYNLNQDILTELNTLIPSAQVTPPQGWEPRNVREARAQQAAAQQAAPAAAEAGR